MKPVIVKWRDAYSIPDNWMHADAPLPAPVIVTSVGYLIPNPPAGYLVLADSVFDNEQGRWFGGVQVIPVGMLVDERVMEAS